MKKNKTNKKLRINIYYRKDNKRAKFWETKIISHFKNNGIDFQIDNKKPEAVIILGGDGTILEAVKKFNKLNPLFLGLNLGHVGFLASARDEKEFLKAIDKFISGKYSITERMMLEANIIRNNKEVGNLIALNDISVQNLLGMVKLSISIDGHKLHNIHGTGALISTATGSTAFNLSNHGPIVMPDIKCFIITEILDHNIPTPPIVVKHNRILEIFVEGFRARKSFIVKKDNSPADVVLSSDGDSVITLYEKDSIKIKEASQAVQFIEFENNYFFKSLEEKFSFG